MSQKWFSISTIVLLILICTLMSFVRLTFGVGGCSGGTVKIKRQAECNDKVVYYDLRELQTMIDTHKENGYYGEKVQHIQCTNCVIVRYYLKQLKWIVETLMHGDSADFNRFRRDLNSMKNHVTQMLSVLYAVKSDDIQHWLWTFFIKITAVQSWNENRQLIVDHLESFSALETVLSRFIRSCLKYIYLPYSMPFNYNMSFTKSHSYVIRDTVFRPLYDNRIFYKTLKYHSWFTVEHIYLTGLWGKEQQLFVGNVVGVSIDWEPVKNRLAKHSASLKVSYDEKMWIQDPYRCVDYHRLIIDLINVRLYSYVCVHLHVYNHLLASGWDDDQKYNTSFHDRLKSAFLFTQLGDRFADDILAKLFSITKNYSSKNVNRVINNVAARIRVIVDAEQQPTGVTDVIDILQINADDLSEDFLTNNLTRLSAFTETLKNEFHPVDLNFVQLFIRASAEDDDKFFGDHKASTYRSLK